MPAREVVGIACQNDAKVLRGKPSEAVVDALNSCDVDLIVSAGYPHRLPIDALRAPRAVNVHPSLLPEARGNSPLPRLATTDRIHCGVTIHETVHHFDAGPILLQERIDLDESEGVDELYLKIFALAPRLLRDLLKDVDGHFLRKAPQSGGSYWPKVTSDDRWVNSLFTDVDGLLQHSKKFGQFGVLVELGNGDTLEATRAVGVRCDHSYPPGIVVATTKLGTVLALSDGLVCLSSPKPAPH